MPELVKAGAELDMPAMALTDQSNLFALVKFYQAARARGMQPIAGADIWLAAAQPDDEPSRMVLLVENETGYGNLLRLCSRAWLENQHQGRAIVRRDWLTEAAGGLIALSSGVHGEIGQALLAEQPDQAEQLLETWRRSFPDRFYLEVNRVGAPGEDICNEQSLRLAAATGCPLVATNDVRFRRREDFEAHEARVCIQQGRVLDDALRPRTYTEEQYLRSAAEMQELWADLPEALENTVEIARRCHFELSLGKTSLPRFRTPDEQTEEQYLRDSSRQGLEERLQEMEAFGTLPEDGRETYFERLRFELDVITKMNFSGYFLIVSDFIQWAKNQDIPVGPGRGSGAGSIVAWALKITDLDPILYDLLFERFLNPERVSMPDFDVDFCMDGRDRVIQYVTEVYGQECVSQIITFGSMAARAVVRDVARVQSKPRGLADRMAKAIPFAVDMTLDLAVEQEESLRELLNDPDAAEIWEMARKLEGLSRNVGKHAGGVVIAPSALTDFVPLYSDGSAGVVSQYDKDDVEKVGLVKFDFLGLRTLTIIDWAVKALNARLAQAEDAEPVDIAHIPLDDEATFDTLKAAKTTAIFQLESEGMKRLIKDLQPTCFEDIVALVALFRPGPLESGMAEDFIQRKHGRQKVVYPHPELEPVLSTTYGTILYQEQVMQIAQVLADYTLGEADMLRRAMGKKKKEIMDQQRGIFTERAVTHGVEEQVAVHIFDQMQEFAKYCFNKSHSAAYALVSYQTAWLKCHYPSEYMAAVLTADMHNKDKLVTMIDECRRMNLTVVPPNVNTSVYRFVAGPAGEIIYGLGAIMDVGEGPVEAIVNERTAQGMFHNLDDFVGRIDLQRANKRVLVALACSGALDGLGAHRAAIHAALPDAVRAAEQQARNRAAGMGDLFGALPESDSASIQRTDAPKIRPWPPREVLAREKNSLGLFLTGHPIEEYESELARFVPCRIADARPGKDSQTLAGVITSVRVRKNKRGERWAALRLEDRSGRIEITLFAKDYAKFETCIAADRLVVVTGEVVPDDYTEKSMRVARMLTISEARQSYARRLRLQLRPDRVSAPAELLQGVLTRHASGELPVVLDYRSAAAQAELELDTDWHMLPTDELIEELREIFGTEEVELDYA